MTADKPVSPFSGLDKALLRSTQFQPPMPPSSGKEVAQPLETAERPEKPNKEAPMRARTHAPTHARTDAPVHMPSPEDLTRKLQTKQRLASSTFRFRPEELEELDRAFSALKEANTRVFSKNDLVRLGLNWLLDDYKRNADKSILVKVLAHI